MKRHNQLILMRFKMNFIVLVSFSLYFESMEYSPEISMAISKMVLMMVQELFTNVIEESSEDA